MLLGHIRDYALRPVPAGAAETAAASGQAPEGTAPLFRPADLPAGLRSLYAALQEERATALSRAAAHYASDAYRELLHKLDGNAAAQTCRPMLDRRGRARPMLLADIMAAGVDQATRDLLAHDRWTHGHLIPEDLLHNMRIAFKQLRYLMAFFGSQGGKNGERLIRLCRRCQESLGQMHDNAVAAATALRHLQHMPETRQHAEDADGLEEYARWCEDEMHRHAMGIPDGLGGERPGRALPPDPQAFPVPQAIRFPCSARTTSRGLPDAPAPGNVRPGWQPLIKKRPFQGATAGNRQGGPSGPCPPAFGAFGPCKRCLR